MEDQAMAITGFYLDTRAVKDGDLAPLKISISKKGKTAYLPTDIKLKPSNWDGRACKVIGRTDRQALNTIIYNKKQKIDNALLRLSDDGELTLLDARRIRDKVVDYLTPKPKNTINEDNLFAKRFLRFAGLKKESTKEIYMHTYKRMVAYVGDELARLRFEDITKDWLTGFDTFLSRTSPKKNARNIHLRNIRAVFNDALDDEITTAYPFRRFKIRPVATPKRSLSVDQLRTLISYPCEPTVAKYVDYFLLSFMLVGINMVDLCHLESINDGRIEYNRSKTSRLYSIKLEPEVMELIDKHRGKKYLLDALDRYANHKDFVRRMNENLRKVGDMERVGRGGRKIRNPLFPSLSSYWARHTWATIAASLDIPKETIAAALGHGGNTVTDIYIDFDRSKVDEANRRVIDWVLYGKK